MSSTASLGPAPAHPGQGPGQRLEVLFEELAQLAGQRNAIDGRIVQIAAEMERDQLCGATGARSVAALLAWKLGVSSANAHTITTVAGRQAEFPRCTQALREGRLSLDQVGVIAARAGQGSDEHYAQLASVATVNQLRTAVNLEPRPDPEPAPAPQASITKTTSEAFACWRIRLAHPEAATFDAALAAHREALITAWKHDRATSAEGEGASESASESAPPMPGTLEAFLRLVETGWDVEATRRPHGQHTTVVMHLDVAAQVGALHLGPALTDDERQHLACDATCEIWFQRDGQPIGAGRSTRTINRRLRRALEHRDRSCVVPGCSATRGLHAHHITHWEDGGVTELTKVGSVCRKRRNPGDVARPVIVPGSSLTKSMERSEHVKRTGRPTAAMEQRGDHRAVDGRTAAVLLRRDQR